MAAYNVINITYLISFLDLLAVGLTFPVLAPHIRSLGASHLTVGILSSTYSVLQVVTGPLIGSWSDVRGRKFVFATTLFLSAVCYLLLGFCSSIYTIFIMRLLLGIVKHTQTLNKAVVADHAKGEDASKVFGLTTAFGSIGFVIGPVIGGHLTEFKSGFVYICSLTALLFLLNIGLVLLLPNDARKKRESNGLLKGLGNELAHSISDLKQVNWNRYWLPFSLKFCFILSTTIFFINHSLHLKEKHNLSQKHIGYMISFISIIGVLMGFLSGWINKRFYGNSSNSCIDRALHCFSIITICFAVFYCISNNYIALLFLLPFGISNGLLRTVTMEIMFDDVDEKDRGSLSGASDSVMSLARFMAPISAGFVGDIFGANAVMLYAMLPATLATLICIKYKNYTAKDKTK